MNNWKWFGHAAHLIVGNKCCFHLATKVGKYLVSTVGEYWPERAVREIHAQAYDPAWLEANRQLKGDTFDSAYFKRFGYETIGCDRKYETFVFKAGAPCKAKDCDCGLPAIAGSEIDTLAANDAKAATQNHMKLCKKWSLR